MFVQFGGEMLSGTATTFLTYKIRRGVDTTGAVVYTGLAITAAAGTRYIFACAAVDQQAGDVSGQTYVCTVLQSAATGNGSATNVWSSVTVG